MLKTREATRIPFKAENLIFDVPNFKPLDINSYKYGQVYTKNPGTIYKMHFVVLEAIRMRYIHKELFGRILLKVISPRFRVIDNKLIVGEDSIESKRNKFHNPQIGNHSMDACCGTMVHGFIDKYNTGTSGCKCSRDYAANFIVASPESLYKIHYIVLYPYDKIKTTSIMNDLNDEIAIPVKYREKSLEYKLFSYYNLIRLANLNNDIKSIIEEYCCYNIITELNDKHEKTKSWY